MLTNGGVVSETKWIINMRKIRPYLKHPSSKMSVKNIVKRSMFALWVLCRLSNLMFHFKLPESPDMRHFVMTFLIRHELTANVINFYNNDDSLYQLLSTFALSGYFILHSLSPTAYFHVPCHLDFGHFSDTCFVF